MPLHAQFYARQYAVVVGIDKYADANWPSLSYARKDAEGVAAMLKQLGYTVFPLYDAQAAKVRILALLEDELAPRLQPNDAVLFFFAGHGATKKLGQEDWGYLVPSDGTAQSATHISMEELQTLSRKMGNAKHQAFIMDCCYGGLLGRKRSGAGGIPTNVPNYLTEISSRTARQILTAGGKDQRVADGGPLGHSVFTGYFLKGIQEGAGDLNRDGWITFNELVSYLLPAASRPNQTPGYDALPGHEQGEFLFRSLKVVTPPATPTVAPAPSAQRGNTETPTENPGSRPASSTSAPTYALRATPNKAFSEDDQINMLKAQRYFESNVNPLGTGIIHEYLPQILAENTVVVDRATGLMWQQSGSPNNMTYAQAQEYVKQMNAENFAGFRDWRLPTLEEAMSLMEPTKKNGDLNIDPLFAPKQRWIWTADMESASRAWYVNFRYGDCSSDVVGDIIYVRVVRSVQSNL